MCLMRGDRLKGGARAGRRRWPRASPARRRINLSPSRRVDVLSALIADFHKPKIQNANYFSFVYETSSYATFDVDDQKRERRARLRFQRESRVELAVRNTTGTTVSTSKIKYANVSSAVKPQKTVIDDETEALEEMEVEKEEVPMEEEDEEEKKRKKKFWR
ncbi:hypothetical protein EVAR_12883_1 [Eumeta japonica]|uniref:Uncharacterized protein n=1 Tax=Eumeta variegata TaxID=151549 RepID=A0A4C1TW41_EUMVA|nr:hypothetical protein EVAR_12883_1 [Eumeta japonica]